MSKNREATPVANPWPEAVRLAMETVLDLPADIPPAPDSPEAVLVWLPQLVTTLRKQMVTAAKKKAERVARRGALRGQGARDVARALEEIGKEKEVVKP